MDEPPALTVTPSPSDKEPLPVGTVVGIVIGGTVGLVILGCLLVLAIRACLRCRRRRQLARSGMAGALDIEAPSAYYVKQPSPRSGPLTTIKETELPVSKSVAANLNPHEELVMNGLSVASTPGGPSNGIALQLRQAGETPVPAKRPHSILRWLESADLATPRDAPATHRSASLPPTHDITPDAKYNLPTSRSQGTPGSSKFSAFNMKAMSGRFSGVDLEDMRKKLLAAAGATGGDSSSHPLDVKGMVFNRLPPSRRSSPAPSVTGMSQFSARSSRQQTRDRHRDGHLDDGDEPPSPTASQISRRSSTRLPGSTPAVALGSQGGVAFASIGSLARTSTGNETGGGEGVHMSVTQGVVTLQPRASLGRVASGSRGAQLPSVLLSADVPPSSRTDLPPLPPSARSSRALRSEQSTGVGARSGGSRAAGAGQPPMNFEDAMNVLKQAAGDAPPGSLPPSSSAK